MTWLLAALKAAAAFFGFAEKVTAEVHDANQRTAGKNEQVNADLKSENATNDAAFKAYVGTTPESVDDSLREHKF